MIFLATVVPDRKEHDKFLSGKHKFLSLQQVLIHVDSEDDLADAVAEVTKITNCVVVHICDRWESGRNPVVSEMNEWFRMKPGWDKAVRECK